MHDIDRNINPYQCTQPTDGESNGQSFHSWNGHSIAIKAQALRATLWQVVAYYVVIDDKETFTDKRIKWNEDFEWEFAHENGYAHGRFVTVGLNLGIRRRYRLFINGVLVAESETRIRDGWKGMLLIVIIISICCFAV